MLHTCYKITDSKVFSLARRCSLTVRLNATVVRFSSTLKTHAVYRPTSKFTTVVLCSQILLVSKVSRHLSLPGATAKCRRVILMPCPDWRRERIDTCMERNKTFTSIKWNEIWNPKR